MTRGLTALLVCLAGCVPTGETTYRRGDVVDEPAAGFVPLGIIWPPSPSAASHTLRTPAGSGFKRSRSDGPVTGVGSGFGGGGRAAPETAPTTMTTEIMRAMRPITGFSISSGAIPGPVSEIIHLRLVI